MVVSGQVSHELEVEVSASQAWKLYGTLALAKLVEQTLTDVIHKIEVVQGDGEVGTILKLTFAPGIAGCGWQKEKFTAIDNEKRVKEVELIEGGFLESGFTFFLVRFEIIETASTPSSSACIIKTSLEYELKEEAAANASLASIDSFANIAHIAKNHLLKNKEYSTLLNRETIQFPGRKFRFPIAVNFSDSEKHFFRFPVGVTDSRRFQIFGDPRFVECRSRVAGGAQLLITALCLKLGRKLKVGVIPF